MRIVTVANSLKSLRSLHFLRVTSSAPLQFKDKQQFEIQPRSATYSPDNDHIVGKSTLAMDLASLLEEPKPKPKPRSRMELKRFFELRIKKRVKQQHTNGKFHDLMKTVISNAETLRDAYNCIRINSNTLDGTSSSSHDASFLDDLAEELGKGDFDVSANTTSFSTRRGSVNKEILVLPNSRLRVVLEAMRIALEVVYKPHFSKISHGCRSGRGCAAALKYVCKGVLNPDWWFTVLVVKKLDVAVLEKLISIMEEKIEDPILYGFIRTMFDAGVLNLEFGGFPKGHGLPQEGVLSPILMNIYLDLFDSEFCRLSMKYEGICGGGLNERESSGSVLRDWFRRQLNGDDVRKGSGVKVYSCRYMDEMFFAVSGSRDATVNFLSEVQSYLSSSLLLDVGDQTDVLSCDGSHGIRFLGTLVRRTIRESSAVKVVHKLKEKVELFTLQKVEEWNYGTLRIGKKWLGHGLKKVKESEIKHLADSSSLLNRVSYFRKSGMKTDHWYKHLLKIWMQDIQAKNVNSEEIILSTNVAEPALPHELKDSFYEFTKQAERYISAEADSILKLLPDNNSSTEHPVAKTETVAPINAIKMRLLRYGLTTSKGYPRSVNLLIMLDTTDIIDWFSGISCRWLKWYENCVNFDEIKLLITYHVRKSCIRTLAAKYRVHEIEIEKRFGEELIRIPSTHETEMEMTNEALDVQAFDNDEALMYGIASSGVCLLSLARIVTQARPCNCFVTGCSSSAPRVYTLHVMERQKSPSWKTGFSTCIHPSLNKRRLGLCKQHLRDLYLGHISLQSIDFNAWKS